MKRVSGFNIEEMLAEMIAGDGGEISAVGREASSMELAEARAALQVAMSDHANKMKTLCIGCGETAALFECQPCECGGFVCPACQKVETEGECHHDAPSLSDEE